MSAQRIENFVTPGEYLALDRTADFKSEYFAGEMVAMSGASRPHERIVVNLTREIGNLLRGKSCSPLGGNLRVSVGGSNYLYPDMTVTCGAEMIDDSEYNDTLLNPTVIFEILSPSTEHKDRGIKWHLYRRIESLQQYVLINQQVAHVEVFTRQQDGDWKVHSEEGLDAVVSLTSIDVGLKLTDLYEDVDLSPRPKLA